MKPTKPNRNLACCVPANKSELYRRYFFGKSGVCACACACACACVCVYTLPP